MINLQASSVCHTLPQELAARIIKDGCQLRLTLQHMFHTNSATGAGCPHHQGRRAPGHRPQSHRAVGGHQQCEAAERQERKPRRQAGLVRVLLPAMAVCNGSMAMRSAATAPGLLRVGPPPVLFFLSHFRGCNCDEQWLSSVCYTALLCAG